MAKKKAKKKAGKKVTKKAGKAMGKKVAPKAAPKAAKKAGKKKARRTVMYSSAGKKLYAKRDSGGKFKDIQQYSKAHAMDIKRSSNSEEGAEAKQAGGGAAPMM